MSGWHSGGDGDPAGSRRVMTVGRGRTGVARRRRATSGETEAERWQRNFAELLQELRVVQTGVQILFAFLLILAFNSGFDASDPFTRTAYLVALLSTAAATALIIGPVPYHRVLFRRQRKPLVVRHAHRMAFTGLVLVVVAMVSTVLLATDEILSRPIALVLSVATGVWFFILWWALPMSYRRRG